MTSHHPPFESLAHLPADLGKAFYLVTCALVGIGVDYVRPRLSHALTAMGARLA